MIKKPSLRQRRQQQLEDLQKSIKKLSPLEAKLKTKSSREIMPAVHSAPFLDPANISQSSNAARIRRGSGHTNKSEGGSLVISSEDDETFQQQKVKFDDKYDILEKIGEGAHGVVSKCISKEKGKLYAVKTLRWEDQHFRSLKMNFINIKQLRHKSLIKYRSLFLNEKLRVCHTVLEYFPHQPLKPQTLAEDELKDVFSQILGALSYLHKHNICHRDIKPDNILYDRENKQVKIIDFGVSKNVKLRGRCEKMLTDTGTFYYKAPQMFTGEGYTEAVDSWAVGILLYEMITGQTPFASEYLIDTKENIINAEINFSHQQFYYYNKLIVKDLISHLLKKNPKERITCAQAEKHLWFNSNIEDNKMNQSAQIKVKKRGSLNKDNDHIDGLTSWVIKRKQSMKGDSDNEQSSPVSHNDKLLTKTWLQTINENNPGHTEDVAIDFVDSDDDFDFKMPLTPQDDRKIYGFGKQVASFGQSFEETKTSCGRVFSFEE